MTYLKNLALHSAPSGTESISKTEQITVLVTGYGPFLEHIKINPSWSVASTLPNHLPATPTCPHAIRLVVPSTPLRVAYAPVAEAVPKLLDPSADSELPKPDFVLHIGLAAGRKFYTLERLSVRGTYDKTPDVDGNMLPVSERARLFEGCPRILKPTFDTGDVWRRWRDNVTDLGADLRESDDPGQYLCGFIYFLSMAWFWKQGKETERPVMFLHVPDLQTDEQVEQGRQVAVGLVRALVASRQKLGLRDPLKDKEEDEHEVADNVRWDGARAQVLGTIDDICK